MCRVSEINIQDAARQQRLEYFRQWRAKNKDKVKKHNEDYWMRRAKRMMDEEQGGEKDDI